MFPRKNIRLVSIAVFFGLCLILIFMISSPSRSSYKSKNVKSNNLMTQSPEHLKKQKEYEKHLMENIAKMTAHNEIHHKMDHDPLGIILHKKESLWDGLGHQSDMEEQMHAIKNSVVLENQLKHKIVHLDLKGAPPKISYLKQLFPLIKSFGATGVLLEYEDMFPYWGALEHLSAHNAYAKGDIADLLEAARLNRLEVIPLIQTFGHMEFVLKLKENINLREVPTYPQVICPTNNKTLPLISAMVDQIMEMHPGINWLHIGCDEIYNLGECTRCQKFLAHQQYGKSDLFLYHVKKISKYVKETYDVQPIIWDDAFRKAPIKAIKDSGIGDAVDIMVWKYGESIMMDLRTEIWEKYSSIFSGIWVASAFKGAASPDSYITDISQRLNNHKEWMELIDLYKTTIPFRGIALTGWQRFDHFAVLCELLPQAIPSLAVNLMYVLERTADHNALARVGEVLKCNSYLTLNLQYLDYTNKCQFPGSKVFEVIQKLYILKHDIDDMLKNPHVKGWVAEYNIEHMFASPQHVEQGLQDLSMLLFDFNKLMSDAQVALKEVYDEYTVNEWITMNMVPTQKQLQRLYKVSGKLTEKTFWPRNPITSNKDKEL